MVLVAIIGLVGGLALKLAPTRAQEGYTPQDAIALAAAHPAFADGLAARSDWTAAAYDTQNPYGIWRVQFWNADGEDLGWADVSLERGQVYSWESYLGLTDDQYAPAEEVIRAFLVNSPEVMELVGSLDEVGIYVDYDPWGQHWGAYIDLWPNSLYVTLASRSDNPFSLDDLQVVQIYFPDVLSYDEWYSGQESKAIAAAFAQPEIAAAVRHYTGWTAAGERGNDGVWVVNFALGEQPLASATVLIETQQVLDFSVSAP
jgi:hypothetical protein